MIKKYIDKSVIILIIVILLGSYYIHSFMSREIPFNPPITVIKYNGNAIASSLGDHNWIPKSGGSSYETGGEYTVGQRTFKFNAKPGGTLHISIPAKPKDVSIDQILGNDYSHKEYQVAKVGTDYRFTLPVEKGEYIFKIFAKWDADKHNTATIFRVEIE